MKSSTLDRLKRLKDKEFDFTAFGNKLEFTYELLEDIGNSDPVIRDELVYPALARLLYRDHLELAENIKIAELLFTERFLFYKIGEMDLPSVYTRTFSALQIAVILFKHNEKPFLSKKQIVEMYNLFIKYFEQENDLRGYDDVNGWAHSVAHAADVFKQFVQAKELSVELVDFLRVIKDKIAQSRYFFINNEDERIISAVDLLIKRDILPKEIEEWIKSFGEYKKESDYKKEFVVNANIKNFLRSLYFRDDTFQESIEETLYIINPFRK